LDTKYGRYNIEGQDIFVLVSCYENKPAEKEVFEAHRQYIDIQYIVCGSECMGYASIDAVKATTGYSSDTDYQLFEGPGDVITAHEGMFVLFAPQDAHMPGISPGQIGMVKKAIVKVRI
jgi:YhcH/YjgK/YiaL family protein